MIFGSVSRLRPRFRGPTGKKTHVSPSRLGGNRRNLPLGPPHKANPLLNVISQTRPQRFQPDLDPSAQSELPQPQFVFDPGVGEFGHARPLFVDLLRRLPPKRLGETCVFFPVGPRKRGLRRETEPKIMT